MSGIYLATEDILSQVVAERVINEANPGLQVLDRMGRKGSGYLKQKLPELLRTAHKIPVFLFTDLDKIECAPSLIAQWRGKQIFPQGLLFRVAVRETEAWLLADRESFAKFCGAPINKIPSTPETLDDPKQALLNLVRQYGSSELKAEIVSERARGVKIGTGYNKRLMQFAQHSWQPQRAAANADSLQRALRRVSELKKG